MAIEPDQQLLHYRLIEQIGEGGMGVVWRARDTTLERDVAIKVLPPGFAADPDRLTRFEREAKLLASLNHPNIATIHGLHEQDGTRFLVMEIVEGKDLSRCLERGRLSIDRAIKIARQIAEALEAAHESGVIHRDLKPANIMLTGDDQVKVLDFGLAKALVTGEPGDDPAQSPTMTSAGTVGGVILGTASYMSPEQARGQTVDRRADIWAFGCVLYELLTGQRVFQESNLSDALAALLTKEPNWEQLPREVPPSIRRLTTRCLDKNASTRLRDIGEARVVLASPQEAVADDLPAPRRAPAERWIWLTAIVALVALLGWRTLAPRATTVTAPDSLPSFTMQRLTELSGAERNPSISPDARQLLYDSASEGDRDIFLQRVGGARAINLTQDSPADDTQAVFSPDGQQIAFRSERDGGGLFVMGSTGESVRRVTDFGFNPTWSPDGSRLAFASEAVDDPYARSIASALWIVEIKSGETTQPAEVVDAVQPAWSPDGRRIAYWANVNGQRDLWTIPAAGGDPISVTMDVATDWSPTWSPDGRWIYFSSDRGGNMDLWRIAIDPETGQVRGEPQRVTGGVRQLGHASISADGRHIALMAYERDSNLTFLTLGAASPCAIESAIDLQGVSQRSCEVSPDRLSLACQIAGAKEDIVVMDIDGSNVVRLTDDIEKDRDPTWTPDGESLIFHSTRSGSWEYWTIHKDGSGFRQLTDLGEISGVVLDPGGGRLVVNANYYDEMWLGEFDKLSTRDSARQLLTEMTGFNPVSWSRTGDLIAGVVYGDDGLSRDYGIYDLSRESYTRLEVPAPAPAHQAMVAGWLPDSRRIVLVSGTDAVVYDSRTGEMCSIAPVEPMQSFHLSSDGRYMTIERTSMDSAVWLLRFEGF